MLTTQEREGEEEEEEKQLGEGGLKLGDWVNSIKYVFSTRLRGEMPWVRATLPGDERCRRVDCLLSMIARVLLPFCAVWTSDD